MHSGALLNIWRWEFDNRRQLLDTSFGARSFVYQALATFRSLVFQTLFWQSESGGEHHLIQENLRCPSGSFKVTVIHLVCLRMEEFTRIFCEIRQKLQKLNFHVHSLSISELSSASFIDLLHDHVDIFHWKSGVIRYISSTDHVDVCLEATCDPVPRLRPAPVGPDRKKLMNTVARSRSLRSPWMSKQHEVSKACGQD